MAKGLELVVLCEIGSFLRTVDSMKCGLSFPVTADSLFSVLFV